MKRSIWIVALAVFAMGMALPGQRITVTSPTAADEWCIGTRYSITWTHDGDMPDQVTVRLRKPRAPGSAGLILTIDPGTANDNELTWLVPRDLEPGQYLIRVRTIGADVEGDSEPFEI